MDKEDVKKYCIESRYQKITRNGVEWTDWFISLTESPSTSTSDLESIISIYNKKDRESRQKLKHEYRIAEYEEPEEVHAFQRMYARQRNKNKKK